MIAGIFWDGSGLGNQLHRYVFTRVKAKDLGVEFSIKDFENFKGKSFMEIDPGSPYTPLGHEFIEERVNDQSGVDIRPYDAKSELIRDDTTVDGEFQDEKYFEHRLDEVREWLKVRPKEMKDNVCVINFRGGEYKYFPDLYLTEEYWQDAVSMMSHKYPGIEFEVHTDDLTEAIRFFPNFTIIQDIEENWRSIRYAKHLILSNSSFAILPALLNEDVKEVIAPMFWARRNKGFWALPQNQYKKFTYI